MKIYSPLTGCKKILKKKLETADWSAHVLDLTWYKFMKAVTVAKVVMAIKPLWPLAQGPTLHICFIVLYQSVLKENNGTLIVALVIQPHCCREQVL